MMHSRALSTRTPLQVFTSQARWPTAPLLDLASSVANLMFPLQVERARTAACPLAGAPCLTEPVDCLRRFGEHPRPQNYSEAEPSLSFWPRVRQISSGPLRSASLRTSCGRWLSTKKGQADSEQRLIQLFEERYALHSKDDVLDVNAKFLQDSRCSGWLSYWHLVLPTNPLVLQQGWFVLRVIFVIVHNRRPFTSFSWNMHCLSGWRNNSAHSPLQASTLICCASSHAEMHDMHDKSRHPKSPPPPFPSPHLTSLQSFFGSCDHQQMRYR